MKLEDINQMYSDAPEYIRDAAEIIVSLYTSGVITLNEVRDFFSLESVKGGDKLTPIFGDSDKD